ncbi:MAG TPA: PilC/PilY family type IV pilus protein [Pseudomonadales bacterium]
MNTQLRIMQFWLGFSGIAAWTCAQGAPLSLANAPLFLGTSVDANVFFELDDSGSMDWETLTNEFDYFKNYWDSGTNAAKVDHGMWESNCTLAGSTSLFNSYCSSGWTGRNSYGYVFRESDRLYSSSELYGSVALYDSRNTEAVDSDWRVRSADFNLVYYNPNFTYKPWTSTMPNADFFAARSNPQNNEAGYDYQRDLSGFVFEVWIDDHGYTGSRPDGPDTATDISNGIVDLWDSRTKYTVNASSMTVSTYAVPANIDDINVDCTLAHARQTAPYASCFGTTASTNTLAADDVNPWGRTLAQEQQNIANWYSYSRKRSYVAKGAIAAVIEATDDFRYGLSLIGDYDDLFVQVPGSAVTNYASHNSSLLNSLFSKNWGANGTPLRAGLERAGKYFDKELGNSYADPIYSQCQQNFTILLTDGYWSGDSVANAIGDADGDGRSKTLADVARYYYNKDLSGLANTVPTSVIDPNNKQHMVTFTVAFGVKGDLVDTDDDGYPNPELDENDTWGDDPLVTTNEAGKIDDLWHAAYNSKGLFINARTPQDLVGSLEESLAEISDRVGSSASVATNSGQLNAGSHVFQARFDSGEWSGQLIAFGINADGTLRPNPSWDAADVLDLQNYNTGRTILTYNPSIDSPSGGAVEGKGIPFRFPAAYKTPNATTEMSSAQLLLLMNYAPNKPIASATGSSATANQNYGAALVNYLRGQRTNEGSGTYAFRTRNAVLGDIVDSDPQYVGPPRFRYPDNLQSAPYSTFVTTHANRTPMVYVGANDGMLHGFQESNGQEKLAYIPNKVFKNLPELSRTNYSHTHFVNEAPTIVDAWLPSYNTSGAWRTVLVGGLGRGGQGIYALDVTDPSTFSEANAASTVLWEFTDADSADLGYTYSQISIAKMANGKWAAVFGNGYNNTEADGAASTTGYASLFIVDIETGDLIRKIDTNAGSTTTPNGLASPALVDADQDFDVDYIYAGDLRGNVWKFDVTGSNPNTWKVAYTASGNPKPLFTTAGGSDQPITTRPVLTSHPTGRDGYMVYFGTGKYIETGDNDPTGAATQAFYGIWDKNLSSHTTFTAANDLVQQFITNQRGVDFNEAGEDDEDKIHTVRDVSDNPVDYATKHGWFIQLLPQKVNNTANASNFGERQVTNALVRNGRVIFTTLLPSQNQCEFGGTSFTMQLDFTNGGLLGDPPFDLNADGTFSNDDTTVGGVQSKVGIIPTLSVIADGQQELAFGSGSSGDVESIRLNPGATSVGRQSWRQVK